MARPSPVLDQHSRPMGDLRVSVTDHCNLRCRYCMPEESYTWLPRGSILSFEEILRLVRAFTSLGARKVRLTGGEPLLRRDLPVLIAAIAALPGVEDLAMTTNGVLLEPQLEVLKAAGLGRLTVSLDTLDPERCFALTRRHHLPRTLASIEAIAAAGFTNTKIDTVVMKGFNDDELADLIEFGLRVGAEVRFIEYMDVGGATHWSPERVMSRAEMLAALAERYGPPTPVGREARAATAARYELSNGAVFGVVSSTTQPFCGACNRSRLTADGTWYRCLYAPTGTDLREVLRSGATDEDLLSLLREVWQGRTDRGAEQRLKVRQRGPSVELEQLRQDPHLEMHTRGG
ncbi:MAG: GTP 3',8-cyclase MoaA [Alphaproteobacteria bacterium]|nr:GTP 3',8-cyclase MoaA [Alphaproteobacteria bacterium]MCB9792402.1 GTP 3',8-cyclase MoaA [Alphaproteobacteria bacterium]